MRIKTSMQDTSWVEITFKKLENKFTNNKVLINLKDISKRKDLESKLSATKQKNELFIGKDTIESKFEEQNLIETEETPNPPITLT